MRRQSWRRRSCPVGAVWFPSVELRWCQLGCLRLQPGGDCSWTMTVIFGDCHEHLKFGAGPLRLEQSCPAFNNFLSLSLDYTILEEVLYLNRLSVTCYVNTKCFRHKTHSKLIWWIKVKLFLHPETFHGATILHLLICYCALQDDKQGCFL